MQLRIGIGYDVHAFAEGRDLFLGGELIAHERGLLGHSDADVLLHALTDAVLGALAWGDLGAWFPNTDERFRGASSSALFAEVWAKAVGEGWSLVNADANVVCERPKLAPHVEAMRQNIAKLFGSSIAAVSVKATTSERLGFTGREEGIVAEVVVLLQRQ